jgi:hypothetical protein
MRKNGGLRGHVGLWGPKSVSKSEKDTKKKGRTMYTQGLGQPRMTVEERIFDMMAQLDEHSEKIPEGMYLQFCDHLKVFHQNVENEKKGLAAEVAGQVVGEDVTGRLWVIAQVADYGPRRCGCCRQLGHNRRTCPQRVQ